MNNPNVKITLEYNAVIMSEYLQLHDRVVRFKDSYSDRMLDTPVNGTVIGFNSGEVYYGHGDFSPPGVYHTLGGPIVRWDDGTGGLASCHEIALLEVSQEERREQQLARHRAWCSDPDGLTSDYFRMRMGDLPETPVIEGDVVRLKKYSRRADDEGWEGELMVMRIDFRNLGTTCNDRETPYPCYTLSPFKDGGVTSNFNHKEFELIRRGNLYHHYYGNKSDIKFADLSEEVSFAFKLRQTTQMRSPTSGNYGWTKDDLLDAIQAGTVDGVQVRNGFFGSGPMTAGYRFLDRELGERVRRATLEGFGRVYTGPSVK